MLIFRWGMVFWMAKWLNVHNNRKTKFYRSPLLFKEFFIFLLLLQSIFLLLNCTYIDIFLFSFLLFSFFLLICFCNFANLPFLSSSWNQMQWYERIFVVLLLLNVLMRRIFLPVEFLLIEYFIFSFIIFFSSLSYTLHSTVYPDSWG